MKTTFLLIALTLLVLTGCTLSVATPTAVLLAESTASAEPAIATEAIASSTPLPEASPTATLEPTQTETVVPTPAVFEPFTARVWAAQVNLRTNPGYLFPSLLQLKELEKFTVLAKAPGGEWLYVQLPDGTNGWIFGLLVEMDYDINNIPLRQPEEIQIVTGRLMTIGGIPINRVQFSLTQKSENDILRNSASTDESGFFMAFMPLNAAGNWTVSFEAISCDSIVFDSTCSTTPGYSGIVEPASQEITLPLRAPLEFIWK